MSGRSGHGAVATALERWAGWMRRFSVPVVVASGLLALGSGWYAAGNLGIDTDTQDLFPDRLEWRRLMNRYLEAFPHAGHSLLVVVDGATPEAADAAQARLLEELQGREELFTSIFAPGAGEFFRRHGLLFRGTDELEAMRERISRFAPWLRRLERSPTLPTFAAVLDSTLDAEKYRDGLDLAPVLGMVGRVFEAAADRRSFRVSWSALLAGGRPGPGDRRRFVMLSPRLDYSRARPGKEALDAVRAVIREAGWDSDPSVDVRLTGRVAMQDEEIRSVTRGAGIAGGLALVLVGLVLAVGLRSSRVIMAAMATLVAGLSATAAFAALTVGRLNLISVAFGVLYIGLGIDYAVHLGLRYRELRLEEVPHGDALRRSMGDVGPSLALSAATTALAFFAFVPTDFVGLSELGVISGSGMIVSLAATVTLMPALLELAPVRDHAIGDSEEAMGLGENALARLPAEHPRAVVVGAAAVGAASLVLVPRAGFDPNPLSLRDPATESVSTYLDLLRDEQASPLTISLLRPSASAARAAARRAEELGTVASARTLGDFVPDRQREKIAVLEEIRATLGPPPSAPAATGRTGAREGRRAVERLRSALLDFLPFADEDERRRADYALLQIARWQGTVGEWPVPGQGAFVRELELSLLGWLPDRLDRLRAGLATDGVTRAELPDRLVRRWVSPDGLHRVEVVPRESLEGPEALERFVTEVRDAFPDATGPPVTRQKAGEVAVSAFRRALLLALASMSVLLVLALRSLRSAAQVMVPLLLAGVVTVAASVALGLPFNFANIIALPLLLGVGVDNGVHMVHRSRSSGVAGGELLQTSTARAVVVSFCTTIFSFGNLAFSPHRGMASMGRLLTVAMAAALVTTVLVLPVLLRGGGEGEGPRGGTTGGPGA